jgi:hypothetical protein
MKPFRNPLANKYGWLVLGAVGVAVLQVALTWLVSPAVSAAAGKEYNSGIIWPEPKVVTPGTNGGPPSDAIVLFDGKNFDAWNGAGKWVIDEDGSTTAKSAISTKKAFGDCQLHLEFASPKKVRGKGQGRGNNGVGFMGHYEIQVLDSWENPTYFDGQCAALYKQMPPMVNASRKPGEWQTYDIVFETPRFEDKKLVRPGYVTVLHNGVLVQNHTEIQGTTSWDQAPKYTPHEAKLPLVLMYHGDPVRFRNIWIREFTQMKGKRPSR